VLSCTRVITLAGCAIMNPRCKKLGKILLVLFLLWVFVTTVIAFGNPYAYDVERIQYNPDIPGTIPPSNVHITSNELDSRPYLREAFEDGKSILIARGDLTDLIPGHFFGPRYAVHRMPIWERNEFVYTITYERNTIWEHNGTYIRFRVRTG